MTTDQILLVMIVALAVAIMLAWKFWKGRNWYKNQWENICELNRELRNKDRRNCSLDWTESQIEFEKTRLADLKEASTALKNQIFIDMLRSTTATTIYRGPR